MEDIKDVVYTEEAAGFRLMFRGPVSFGAFFFTRCLYAIDAKGSTWQENIFIIAVGVLTLATFALDVVALAVMWFARMSWYILCGLWRAILYVFRVVVEKCLGTALKWVTVALIMLIIYLKWDEITSIISRWSW